MQFVSFWHENAASYGVHLDQRIYALPPRLGAAFPDLRSLLAHGGIEQARRAIAGAQADCNIADVRFLPVIPHPAKILCIGLNYEDHRLETSRPKMAYPTVFTRFADTQVGHECELIKPALSNRMDYEGELAVIIGTAGRHIPAAEAFAHVAGYACYNDASIRDFQGHTSQFTPGKNFPATGAFGPYLVTADEVGAVGPQRIQTRLNGKIMQDAHLREMIFSIDRLIAYLSSWTPLAAGDVIVTGTPGGVGMRRVPPLYMNEGDEIVVEIDAVGELRNRIVTERPVSG